MVRELEVNGKPLRIVATAPWNEAYGGLEGQLYISLALTALARHPVDMLVFEEEGGTLAVRSAGYDLATDSVLDEKTVILRAESLPLRKFWLKLDDYGDSYVGTFLFPEDW